MSITSKSQNDGIEQTDRIFLFGYSQSEQHTCPAVAAGYNPKQSDNSERTAIAYDGFMTDYTGVYEGTIPESVAKRAWNHAIAETEDTHGIDSNEAKAARDVAVTLGWRR